MDIQTVIANRLEDIANQVEYLYHIGNLEDARLLRQEGLDLAEAYDSGVTFMFLNDFTEVQ
jgi:hypothetical protein